MTHTRVGEICAGRGLTAKGEACLKNYEDFSGKEVDRSSLKSAEMIMSLQGCYEAEILRRGLEGADRALDHASFIGAMDRIESMESRSHGRISFAPAKHHGVD